MPSFAGLRYDGSQELASLGGQIWKDLRSPEIPITQGVLASIPGDAVHSKPMAGLEPGSEARYWQQVLDKLERRERLNPATLPSGFRNGRPRPGAGAIPVHQDG